MSLPISGELARYSVIAAMIPPAFFLTATSSLVATSNTRLGRVVDRMRLGLAELREQEDAECRQELVARIALHRRRSSLVLAALRLLYAAISAFVGTSLGIAIDSFIIDYRLDSLPTLLAVAGVLLMLVASICLGLEARISVRMLDAELDLELARQPAGSGR